MTTAPRDRRRLRRTHAEPDALGAMEVADDLVPVVGVIFQAGPPAYAIVAFGAVVTLLACSPLMILAAVLLISLAVVATLAALVAALVIVPLRLAGAVREHVTHRAPRPVARPRAAAAIRASVPAAGRPRH